MDFLCVFASPNVATNSAVGNHDQDAEHFIDPDIAATDAFLSFMTSFRCSAMAYHG